VTEQALVKTNLEDGIFTLTINRPESMNAMNQTTGNQIRQALRLAVRDPEVRVVIVTGAGRAFSAGGDIKNLGNADPSDALAAKYGNDPRWNGLEMRRERLVESALTYDLFRTMPKPTIAMVNGPAIGAGMALAMACDFRVCSDTASFNTAYVSMGLSGDIGSSYHLINVLGPAKARELLFFPRKIEAKEALSLGLVTRVVPHDSLGEETLSMARQLARGPTLTFGHLKENITAALELDPRNAFDIEARNFIRCFETADHKEAVAAFKERRKPVFTGS
jgi:2-(1,2-epoxy-1,2-dihydrophenyl)acetyl-CoA isomerase